MHAFRELPLVFRKLCIDNSITVDHLKQLGVADIAERIAERSTQFSGRLTLFAENWQRICTDRWVLGAIQGYQIEWSARPHQWHKPPCHRFSKEETESLNSEVQKMLEKGAISPVRDQRDGFLSSIFVVPKKDGGHPRHTVGGAAHQDPASAGAKEEEGVASCHTATNRTTTSMPEKKTTRRGTEYPSETNKNCRS